MSHQSVAKTAIGTIIAAAILGTAAAYHYVGGLPEKIHSSEAWSEYSWRQPMPDPEQLTIPLTWVIGLIAATIVPFIAMLAGAMWKIHTDIVRIQLDVAKTYVTKADIHEIESRVLDELNDIRERLDRLIERNCKPERRG